MSRIVCISKNLSKIDIHLLTLYRIELFCSHISRKEIPILIIDRPKIQITTPIFKIGFKSMVQPLINLDHFSRMGIDICHISHSRKLLCFMKHLMCHGRCLGIDLYQLFLLCCRWYSFASKIVLKSKIRTTGNTIGDIGFYRLPPLLCTEKGGNRIGQQSHPQSAKKKRQHNPKFLFIFRNFNFFNRLWNYRLPSPSLFSAQTKSPPKSTTVQTT